VKQNKDHRSNRLALAGGGQYGAPRSSGSFFVSASIHQDSGPLGLIGVFQFVLDGQHCIDDTGQNTDFGVLC
jgi:hypothetical protein